MAWPVFQRIQRHLDDRAGASANGTSLDPYPKAFKPYPQRSWLFTPVVCRFTRSDEYFVPDFKWDGASVGDYQGAETYAEAMKGFFRALPDTNAIEGRPGHDQGVLRPQPLSPDTPASIGDKLACVVDKVAQFAAELEAPETDAEERLFALKFILHFVGHAPTVARVRQQRCRRQQRKGHG